ncbi:MAG: sterol desaturase family protein [Candidatus Bathyarchaeota archaeon]|nr:sterol desaturase family protein [Candidatus Bathyarchaeota archaeon]
MIYSALYSLFYVSIVVLVFAVMEGVAWFLHKYLMHGIGWYLHADHHGFTGKRFQKNDVFGVFFAIMSFILILTGALSRFDLNFALGIGIALYGIGYLLVHDIFFHRRIRLEYRPRSKYMRRILNAHAIHHQKSTAQSGINFGFLYASKKYATG